MARRRVRSRALTVVRSAPRRARRYFAVRSRRYGSRKISIAKTLGFAYPVALTVSWFRKYMNGFAGGSPPVPGQLPSFDMMLRYAYYAFMAQWVGYRFVNVGATGYVWDVPAVIRETYGPIFAGMLVHRLANRFGLNRMVKRLPYVQV